MKVRVLTVEVNAFLSGERFSFDADCRRDSNRFNLSSGSLKSSFRSSRRSSSFLTT